MLYNNFSVKCPKAQNGHVPVLAYFGGHFCYHNTGQSLINTRLLHFCYWEEIGEKHFLAAP